MGRIKTTLIKRLGKEYTEKFYDNLGLTFEENKKFLNEKVSIQSKSLRNVLAGYITRLMRMKKAQEAKQGA